MRRAERKHTTKKECPTLVAGGGGSWCISLRHGHAPHIVRPAATPAALPRAELLPRRDLEALLLERLSRCVADQNVPVSRHFRCDSHARMQRREPTRADLHRDLGYDLAVVHPAM